MACSIRINGITMVQKFYDELAYGMERVLADEGYQKIFAKPKIKTASAPAPEPVKLSADGITDTFKTIVALSSMLDEMGYEESATKLLRVAQDITDKVQIDEFDPNDEEAIKYLEGMELGADKPTGPDDLDDLLRELGKDGGVWDVSQAHDTEYEKEPEKTIKFPDVDKAMEFCNKHDNKTGVIGHTRDKSTVTITCRTKKILEECLEAASKLGGKVQSSDANDAMDKPSDDDKEEGNPEC